MKVTKITTELLVENIAESVQFYTELLDFKVEVQVPETNPFFVILTNNQFELMLYHRPQFSEEIPDFATQKMGGTVALYLEITDIKAVYSKIKNKVTVIQDLHQTNYGSTEFSFRDNSGYVLILAERN